jgi:hypothetical protein
MRFYQFIDEHNIKEYTKKYVIVDGKQISHPSAETLLKAGIKPLVIEDMPQMTETQYAEPCYIDNDTEIVQKWRIVDIPVEEVIDDEVTDA